jgi:predicted Zn-dependent protease with MMP-like domain
MTRRHFEAIVRQALREIPREFRNRLENVEIVVEDDPSPELLAELGSEEGETLFGLYQGTPLTERSWTHGNTLPDRIVLFRNPLEAACADDDQLVDEVCLTLIHEAGHYFGLSEDEIQQVEDEFWYADPEADDEDEAP